MARKLLLILASLTLVVAGGALYLALSKSPASAAGATRSVLVVTGDLPPGTPGASLTDAQVQTVEVSTNLVPADAVTAVGQVATLQSIGPLFRGQILMGRMFAPTSATGGLPIPQGTNAITLQITDSGRVAGFVQPGSKVVVYDTAKGSDAPGSVVLQSAVVIAVGPTTSAGQPVGGAVSNKNAAVTLVTFALSPKDSIKVVGREDLYLGLLPS